MAFDSLGHEHVGFVKILDDTIESFRLIGEFPPEFNSSELSCGLLFSAQRSTLSAQRKKHVL